MCGIAGHINKNQFKTNASEVVSVLLNSIKHRGPDDAGVHIENNYGSIGMRRLSIQDLSNNGHQPMYSEDSLVCIVYNGEIYNAAQRKKELIQDGYIFKSNSDTEVILNLYLKYNEDCLLYIEGMFAFAIIDKRIDKENPKLFLARDQVGIKPLYYSINNSSFTFCSELTPFISARIVKQDLDSNSLRQLLNYGSIKQPNTIFKDIKMLMPGHKLIYKNGILSIEKYWDLQLSLNSFRAIKNPFENPIDAIENSLRNSVREQLCGDVKIGAFLSGGIDSSLITALLSQESNHKISTYSVGFNSNLNLKSELNRAKVTAKYLGTDHNEIIVDEEYILGSIEKFICSLDQPSVDGINTYVISEYTAKHVKVAISGTGGDELFAGYPWFRSMVNFSPSFLSNQLSKFNFLSDSPIGGKYEKLISKKDFITYFSSLHQTFNLFEIKKLTKSINGSFNLNTYSDFENCDVLKDEDSVLNRVTGLLLNTYLLNQLLRDIDACSMSKSLEVRVPFLSLDVIYNSLCIKDSLKLGKKDLSAPFGSYKRNGEKLVLFEIAKKYLPKDFDLIPKNGFTLPFDDWLKGPLKKMVDDSIDYLIINQSNYFNDQFLLSLKNDYYNNKEPWYKIWILMILGRWLKNIDFIREES